jgi:hypothetical protein
MIDICSSFANRDMQDGDYYAIELQGLIAGQKYDLFGIESPYKGGKLVSYEPHSIPEGEMRRVLNVRGALAVGIRNWALERIKVNGNGFAAEYLQKELQILAYKQNDIIAVRTAVFNDGDAAEQQVAFPCGGFDNFFFIALPEKNQMFNITDVYEVEVVTTGGAGCNAVVMWPAEK